MIFYNSNSLIHFRNYEASEVIIASFYYTAVVHNEEARRCPAACVFDVSQFNAILVYNYTINEKNYYNSLL